MTTPDEAQPPACRRQCQQRFEQTGEELLALPRCFVSSVKLCLALGCCHLLRLHGIAQRDHSVGFVAKRGGNHDGAVLDCGFRCQNLILNCLGRDGGKVLVGHDAHAAFGEAEVDELAPVGAARIPFVKDPNDGVANVFEAGGQRDG